MGNVGKMVNCRFNENNINGNELQGRIESNHAEISSLCSYLKRNDWRDLKYFTIIVIRINVRSELRSSFPCVKCLAQIKRFNIRNIIFVNDEGELMICRTRDIPEGFGHRCRI